MAIDPNTPVLIGCGQITEPAGSEKHSNPLELMTEAARAALMDTGREGLEKQIDTVVCACLTVDAVTDPNPMTGLFSNVPKTLANQLGATPKDGYYSAPGGNSPQMLVNHFAEQIVEGHSELVLLAGAEALKTMTQQMMQGNPLEHWQDDPGGKATPIGEYRAPITEHEGRYDLFFPANTYPLFENALRAKYGRTVSDHQRKLGELFKPFSERAASNPRSWFPKAHSVNDLIEVTADNRYIGFPYPKRLNSVIQVNQSAALVLCSVGKARELGIADDRLVFLHGCADANDIWNLSNRVNYHSSPAIRTAGRVALEMAGRGIDEMKLFDIYSCFPSAVEVACDELGIAQDDSRGLTLTGGLPYFGGPGNNYGMHAIAEMVAQLRAVPGEFGLLNGNGWFLTKHSVGVYSTTPIEGPWQRPAPSSYQQEVLAQTGPQFTETPSGKAEIETYTVLHNRKQAERGLVIGRQADGTRFLADTPVDQGLFSELMESEGVGRTGSVTTGSDSARNLFSPD